jgi:peptidoglycan/LPS O-acetylase OafA/YrhL
MAPIPTPRAASAGPVQRWLALDAARGAAAMAVVIFHLHSFGPDPIPAGYRAVDFFFILSGFVIAHAYEARLGDGLSFGRFALIRIGRLYPLYLLGLMVGLAQLVVQQTALTHDPVGLAASLVTGLLMLPGRIAGVRYIYPLNNPSWSLFYELVVNAAFALTARWLTPVRLILVVAISLLALTGLALVHKNLSIGAKWDRIGLPGGLTRVSFSFFAGVLIHRYRPSRAIRSDLATAAIAIAPVLACIVGPYDWRFDLPIDVVCLPALVWIGAAIQPRSAPVAAIAAVAGTMSYGLYALHFPILLWMSGLAGSRIDPHLAMAATGAAALAAAYLATRFFDEPLRRRLARRRAAVSI